MKSYVKSLLKNIPRNLKKRLKKHDDVFTFSGVIVNSKENSV